MNKQYYIKRRSFEVYEPQKENVFCRVFVKVFNHKNIDFFKDLAPVDVLYHCTTPCGF